MGVLKIKKSLTHKELVEAMNKRNKIQEVNESPFEKYQEEINYDIILEGTIPYDITGIEDSPEPAPEQIQDGEEQIFKQLESDMSNEDYLYEAFEDTGIARGRMLMKVNCTLNWVYLNRMLQKN